MALSAVYDARSVIDKANSVDNDTVIARFRRKGMGVNYGGRFPSKILDNFVMFQNFKHRVARVTNLQCSKMYTVPNRAVLSGNIFFAISTQKIPNPSSTTP